MRIKETRDVAKMIVNLQNSEKGTSNYEDLENKPTINGVTVEGALTSADLGVSPETFILEISPTDLMGDEMTFDSEEDVAKIDRFLELWLANKNPTLGFHTIIPGGMGFGPVDQEITAKMDVSMVNVVEDDVTRVICGTYYDGISAIQICGLTLTHQTKESSPEGTTYQWHGVRNYFTADSN